MSKEVAYTCKTCEEPLETMVDMVMHECSEILRQEDLSRKAESTLLYIDSCVVDHRGKLDHRRMNFEDTANIKLFHAADILSTEDFQVTRIGEGYWDLVSECREARARRKNSGMEMM